MRDEKDSYQILLNLLALLNDLGVLNKHTYPGWTARIDWARNMGDDTDDD